MGSDVKLVNDYEHPTPHGGRCRVRRWSPESDTESHVVVITEYADNAGQSVTNCVEQVAAEIFLGLALPTERTVVVEHYENSPRGYEKESFDLVTFSGDDPEPVMRAGVWRVELGSPSWKPLDRASVETLIGAPLDG